MNLLSVNHKELRYEPPALDRRILPQHQQIWWLKHVVDGYLEGPILRFKNLTKTDPES